MGQQYVNKPIELMIILTYTCRYFNETQYYMACDYVYKKLTRSLRTSLDRN